MRLIIYFTTFTPFSKDLIHALGMGLDSDSEGLRAGVGGVRREKKMGISGQEKSTHTQPEVRNRNAMFR